MSFLTKMRDALLPEETKEKIIKHQVKKQINNKLGLNGALDTHVDKLAEKVFEKVDASTVFKAKDMFDKLKAAPKDENK